MDDGHVQSASKDPVSGEAALSLLDGVQELLVARGKKILSFDLRRQRHPDDELLQLLLGRSGKLRAPCLRSGKRLLVGYNQELMSAL
jgi:arsenate reductase-like glutaredoxin family protein